MTEDGESFIEQLLSVLATPPLPLHPCPLTHTWVHLHMHVHTQCHTVLTLLRLSQPFHKTLNCLQAQSKHSVFVKWWSLPRNTAIDLNHVTESLLCSILLSSKAVPENIWSYFGTWTFIFFIFSSHPSFKKESQMNPLCVRLPCQQYWFISDDWAAERPRGHFRKWLSSCRNSGSGCQAVGKGWPERREEACGG